MGTQIQSYGITDFSGNNDILNISHPEIIEEIHRSYIEAGADIITTNTFNSNAVSQTDYGCEDLVYKLNFEGARIARRATEGSGKIIFVAGSIGPTSKSLSLSPDANAPEFRNCDFDDLAATYKEQVRGLIDGGVDLLLIETVYDGLNAKAALYAVATVQEEKDTDLPVMLSMTINDKSGRMLTGQSIEALFTSVAMYPLLSFGFNCSFGGADLYPFIERLSGTLPCYLSVYPNAGLPNEMGGYDEKPEFTASVIADMAKNGLINIAGGCCGTTPDHIRQIKKAVDGCAPRKLPEIQTESTVSGLNKVVISRRNNFVNIGERTNVAGSAKFAGLIREKKYAEAAKIAAGQIRNGASIIDINTDDAMLDSAEEMQTFLRYIAGEPDIASVPFMIDSSDWKTILNGLKNIQGKPIVNSISLKEGEDEFLRKAKEIKRMGAAVVVMAFDEKGQATDYENKIAICSRAYKLLTEKAGYSPYDIIFDVNVLTIATGIAEHNNYAVDFINAVKWIKSNLKGCLTSAGVSNLSFAFRGNNIVREAMHSVFLYHAIQAGLDMAIVNPAMLQIYDDIEPSLLRAVEDVVMNKDDDATERLTLIADNIRNQKNSNANKAVDTETWRNLPINERLLHALVKGTTEYLAVDLKEILADSSSPIAVIEGPLMEAMDKIGSLFSEGKMFLPQVVKSARVMKEAVDILQPAIEEFNLNNDSVRSRKKMVIATVKGDVHDIGKNIVNIILSCNDIEVVDLGVMIDNERIISAALECDADLIGVSGLITPSLSEMENLCMQLAKRKMRLPLIVGGATTSPLHTAVKLANIYDRVIYGGDASRTAGIVKKVLADSEGFFEELHAEQQKLCKIYASKSSDIIDYTFAKQRAPKFSPESFVLPESFGEHNLLVNNLDVRDLLPLIDWTAFFRFWGFKGAYPEMIYSDKEAEKLYEAAVDMLGGIIVDQSFQASLTARFFNAYSEDDCIVLDGEHVFPMLRQQNNIDTCYSLADFVKPKEINGYSAVGLFCLKIEDLEKSCDGQEFNKLLRDSLRVRCTETLAEWMSQKLSEGKNLLRPAFGYSTCPDHSMKRDVFALIEAEKNIGVTLTETYGIIPSTAICGMLIAHPEARYFNIPEIGKDQFEVYCGKRRMTEEEGRKLLNHILKF